MPDSIVEKACKNTGVLLSRRNTLFGISYISEAVDPQPMRATAARCERLHSCAMQVLRFCGQTIRAL